MGGPCTSFLHTALSPYEEHAPSTKALTTPVPSSWGPSTTQCAVVPGRAGSDEVAAQQECMEIASWSRTGRKMVALCCCVEVSAQQEVPVRAPARFAAAVYNQVLAALLCMQLIR
eukprot:6275828-Amphidinium_carterae.2